jgi:hypothetical protein
MHDDLGALLLLIVAGAAWLVVHVRLLMRVAREPSRGRLRWLAILPPATPVIGWLCGARVLAALWGTFGLIYLALRTRL